MGTEQMTTLEVLLQWEQLLYPIIVIVVGGLAWLFRLEAKANNNLRDVKRLEKTIDKELQQVDDKLQMIERLIRSLCRDVNQLIGSLNGKTNTTEGE